MGNPCSIVTFQLGREKKIRLLNPYSLKVQGGGGFNPFWKTIRSKWVFIFFNLDVKPEMKNEKHLEVFDIAMAGGLPIL